jgi:hypothetical protein
MLNSTPTSSEELPNLIDHGLDNLPGSFLSLTNSDPFTNPTLLDISEDLPSTPDALFPEPDDSVKPNSVEAEEEIMELSLNYYNEEILPIDDQPLTTANSGYTDNDLNSESDRKKRKVSNYDNHYYPLSAELLQLPINPISVYPAPAPVTVLNVQNHSPVPVMIGEPNSLPIYNNPFPINGHYRDLNLNCPDFIGNYFSNLDYRTTGVIYDPEGFLVIDMIILHQYITTVEDRRIERARLEERFHPSKQWNQVHTPMGIENKYLKVIKNQNLMNRLLPHDKERIKIAVLRIKQMYNCSDHVRIYTRSNWNVIPRELFLLKPNL